MTEDSQGKRLRPTLVLAFTFSLVVLYLFSTGPVTRYFPKLADEIYAPLSPLVKSKAIHPLFRTWFTIWGIDMDGGPKVIVPTK
jgi:hypothetical protein